MFGTVISIFRAIYFLFWVLAQPIIYIPRLYLCDRRAPRFHYIESDDNSRIVANLKATLKNVPYRVPAYFVYGRWQALSALAFPLKRLLLAAVGRRAHVPAACSHCENIEDKEAGLNIRVEWLPKAPPKGLQANILIVCPTLLHSRVHSSVPQRMLMALRERVTSTEWFVAHPSGAALINVPGNMKVTSRDPMDNGVNLRNFISYLEKAYPQSKLFAVAFSAGADSVLRLVARPEEGQKKEPVNLQGLVVVSHGVRWKRATSNNALLHLMARLNWLADTFENDKNTVLLSDDIPATPTHIGLSAGPNAGAEPSGQHNRKSGFTEASSRLSEHSLPDSPRVPAAWEDMSTYTQHVERSVASLSIPTMANTSVPTLVIHSRDDPIVPYRSLPLASVQKNPNIILISTARGGHAGFVDHPFNALRTPMKSTSIWLDSMIASYLTAVEDDD